MKTLATRNSVAEVTAHLLRTVGILRIPVHQYKYKKMLGKRRSRSLYVPQVSIRHDSKNDVVATSIERKRQYIRVQYRFTVTCDSSVRSSD